MTHNPNNTADVTAGQARPPKPNPLTVIPENIPIEINSLDQWVCWRYTWDEDAEKWTKYPLNPRTGNLASSTDPKTWTTFAFAYQRYLDSQSESWRFDGIGLVLTDKNNTVGFDLDHCRDPETDTIDPIALGIVDGLPTYWEISPSGTGLRGFAFGRKPGGRCRSGDFEVYQHSRYLVITGHHLEGTPTSIAAVQDGIDACYAQIFPPKETYAPGTYTNGTHLEYEDQLILDAARRARNGADFIALFDEGDRQRHLHDDGSPDYSRSDESLCRLLAFFTKHEEQMDRLFRVSALNRPKWESRPDYRQRTITLAIQSTPDQWSGPSASRNGQPPETEYNASQLCDEPDVPQGDITVEHVIETFRDWLDLPDPGFIEVMLGDYAANQMPGDPVWILVVGPSSGGKTEPLQSMLGLPHTKLASTLTESALLSGSPKRDKDKTSTGGLLREIGDFGYLILKDFTSVLAMQDKIRMTTVAALRDIYDGKWDRPLGIDGGKVLSWKGRMAILAGCTDVIDSHHTLMTAMGSRFLMYRLPPINAHAQALKAYSLNAKENEMRQALQRVVRQFFHGKDYSEIRPTQEDPIRERIIQLSMLAVVARSPIERDRQSREITLIPDAEAPARVTKALGKLYAGLCAVGVSPDRAWLLVRKIGFDSMPKLRWALLEKLSARDEQTSWDLAIEIHHPTNTVKRALQDLDALKLVERKKVKGQKGDRWSLTDEAAGRLRALLKIAVFHENRE